MKDVFSPVPPGSVKLLPSTFQHRFDLNYTYVLSLRSQNLLQNYYLEAGLWSARGHPEGIHWGWEAPTCQLRGHFLGHWLSAAVLAWALPLIMGLTAFVFRDLGRWVYYEEVG